MTDSGKENGSERDTETEREKCGRKRERFQGRDWETTEETQGKRESERERDSGTERERLQEGEWLRPKSNSIRYCMTVETVRTNQVVCVL